MIVFLDASALIYLIEGQPDFAASVRAQLNRVVADHPNARIGLSRLSWLECRVGPMKRKDQAALAAFDRFLAMPDLFWAELDRHVVEQAATLRVRHKLRTPDALQAASCLNLVEHHVFVTGDGDFRRVDGLQVLLIGGS